MENTCSTEIKKLDVSKISKDEVLLEMQKTQMINTANNKNSNNGDNINSNTVKKNIDERCYYDLQCITGTCIVPPNCKEVFNDPYSCKNAKTCQPNNSLTQQSNFIKNIYSK